MSCDNHRHEDYTRDESWRDECKENWQPFLDKYNQIDEQKEIEYKKIFRGTKE